ncbi:MAG: NAD(P)-binding domain-containing protein [Caldilineaceae bacterium]
MKTPTALKTNQKLKNIPHAQDLMQIGVIGLGTMGRNFLLNIADHGFGGAGYDKSTQAVKTTPGAGRGSPSLRHRRPQAFVQALERPRDCGAGPRFRRRSCPLTDVIPLLSAGDIIVDGGNPTLSKRNGALTHPGSARNPLRGHGHLRR